MTVTSETAYATRLWTGGESVFAAGFSVERTADVTVSYLDANGLPIALVAGVHYTADLDGNNALTISPLMFPSASLASPVTIAIERNTPAVQGTDFRNLRAFDAATFGFLFDRAFYILGELKSRLSRTIPYIVSEFVVDFRPRRVKAAPPQDPTDVATKLDADTVSGANAQAAAEAARDVAIQQSAIASNAASTATAGANAAQGYAAILANPDYGFYTDAVSTSRDYGTYV